MLEDDEGDADGPASAYPEPDPEAELPDPEEDLPSVPSIEAPSPPTPDGDVPDDLLRGFWTTVLLFNVALGATSVGAMMVAFDVERRLGVAVLAVGLFSLVRGYRKYRHLADQQAEGAWTDDEDREDGAAPHEGASADAGDAERNG